MFWAVALPAAAAAANAAQAAIQLIFFKTSYPLDWYSMNAKTRAAPLQRRWLRGKVNARAADIGGGAIRSAGCDSAEFIALGGVPGGAHWPRTCCLNSKSSAAVRRLPAAASSLRISARCDAR